MRCKSEIRKCSACGKIKRLGSQSFGLYCRECWDKMTGLAAKHNFVAQPCPLDMIIQEANNVGTKDTKFNVQYKYQDYFNK